VVIKVLSFLYGMVFSLMHYFFVRFNGFSDKKQNSQIFAHYSRFLFFRLFIFIPFFVFLAIWLGLSMLFMVLGMVVTTFLLVFHR
jgi:Flp pilus assembly protein TadB